jgi:hypothetical protein
MGDRRRTLLRLLQAVVAAAAAGLIVLRFMALDAVSHSASDTLRPWIIQAGLIALTAFGVVVVLDRLGARGDR